MASISANGVDTAGSAPRYLALKADLLQELSRLEIGSRFPSQHKIMKRTGLAYETVSRALREMVADGYVRRETGSGTFVCRRPGDVMGRVVAWFMKGEGSGGALRTIAREFCEANPLVEVDLSSEGRRMESADLVEATSTSFLYLSSGFAPVPAELEARARELLDPRCLDVVRVEGRLLGLPVMVSPQVLYVNDDLFEAAGVEAPSGGSWGWDEMMSRAREVHDPEAGRSGWASPRDLQTLAPFVWQNGGRLFDETASRCELGQDAAAEAVAFWAELEEMSPLSAEEHGSAAKTAFIAGRVGLFPYGGSMENELGAGGGAKFRWRALELPAAREKATALRFTAIALRRRIEDEDAAVALTEHLVGPRTQAELLGRRCLLPCGREVLASGEPVLRPHLDALETARPYIIPGTEQACAALAAGLRLLWEKGADPAETARQLALIAEGALRNEALGVPGVGPEI